MARELKFRGKSLDTGEWVYGTGVHIHEDLACIIHKQGLNLQQHTGVDPETVGQFTGIKDYNGDDIYEGDEMIDEYGVTYEVVFRHGGFEKDNLLTSTRLNDSLLWLKCVVTGNIHDLSETQTN